MSASFYDILRYAKTGIASPEMTAYDKMRAVAMAGGGAIKTLTGVPPLTFKADGKPLISWSMLGNGVQNGTPAPDTPIMPEFVGERTENLFNATWESGSIGPNGGMIADINAVRTAAIPCSAEKTYTFVPDIDDYGSLWVNYYGTTNTRERIDTRGGTFTTPQGCEQVRFRVTKNNIGVEPVQQYNAMLTEGSTVKPYEPYGWKIPITNAGQTTPVYLGQVQTTRKIKKLVLTGEEGWNQNTTSFGMRFLLRLQGSVSSDTGAKRSICTHYPLTYAGGTSAVANAYTISSNGNLYISSDTLDGVVAFKQWLADQYAAGTPVTVWYVLAESSTAIVNEPLAKIDTYADRLDSADAGITIPTAKGANTLTVDTELQPSEMTITYRG